MCCRQIDDINRFYGNFSTVIRVALAASDLCPDSLQGDIKGTSLRTCTALTPIPLYNI